MMYVRLRVSDMLSEPVEGERGPYLYFLPADVITC